MTINNINYIDLFSGIGGFRLGLLMAGFKFNWVGFSEIDKYAIKVYEKNFPESENLGDITKIDGNEIKKRINQIDLITGGFPCQDISIAGKGKGINGPRSNELDRIKCLGNAVVPQVVKYIGERLLEYL